MDPGELKKSRFKSARPPQRENKEWSLEVKSYHFASLFEVLPPSNSQVKSGIAFYNLSYPVKYDWSVYWTARAGPDVLNLLSYGPMDARALWTTCRTLIPFSYKKNFPFAHELFSACL